MLDLTKTSSFSSLVPTITSIAFHEREYSHLGVLATGGPDGSITLRTWTADGTPEGERAQWEFLTIRTMKVRMLGQNRPPSVTALKFLGWGRNVFFLCSTLINSLLFYLQGKLISRRRNREIICLESSRQLTFSLSHL